MNIVAYKPSDKRINRQQLAQHLRQMLQQVIILIVISRLSVLFAVRKGNTVVGMVGQTGQCLPYQRHKLPLC